MRRPGELAIVLHTHMPYVEGFGTWPFGEEWLWEAVATSYLPLLDRVLAPAGAPLGTVATGGSGGSGGSGGPGGSGGSGGSGGITLSLTPVLCDQLEAPGALDRCMAFLNDVRPESHRLDVEQFTARGDARAAAELQRSADEYARAALRLAEIENDRGLLAALGEHAAWTSAATHAVLPLLALDEAVDLQLRTGIESHRRRFGEWAGGFWLPECAYAPWLAEGLEESGVRVTCVELTGHFGLGDPRHLAPLRTDEGPILVPVDRCVVDLVWGARGYPSQLGYRAYDRLTERHHRVWCTDGSPYDHDRATQLARGHAADFVERVKARVADGGLCVCALDTELLGHWWYEGIDWLAAVVREAGARGLALTRLDDAALERHPPVPASGDLGGPTSWGEGNDLRTWSGPDVADLAWRARTAELRTFTDRATPPGPKALRELLALQSSDWAFLAHRGWAGDYPHQRALGHAEALERALHDAEPAADPALRNLAPVLAGGG
jgi:1,4-alpha-glucan branching enzyme